MLPTGDAFFIEWNNGGYETPHMQLQLNTTYHLVGVRDMVNGLSFYVNGQLVGTNAYTGGGDYRPIVTIGRHEYSDTSVEGVIDEVAIYGSALTSTQIQNHYAAGLVP